MILSMPGMPIPLDSELMRENSQPWSVGSFPRRLARPIAPQIEVQVVKYEELLMILPQRDGRGSSLNSAARNRRLRRSGFFSSGEPALLDRRMAVSGVSIMSWSHRDLLLIFRKCLSRRPRSLALVKKINHEVCDLIKHESRSTSKH
jgi:hypothetical protein